MCVQCVCVCVRGLSGLLLQTMLQPTPGNPHAALLHQRHKCSNSRAATSVQQVLQHLQERCLHQQRLITNDCPTTSWHSTVNWLPLGSIAAALDEVEPPGEAQRTYLQPVGNTEYIFLEYILCTVVLCDIQSIMVWWLLYGNCYYNSNYNNEYSNTDMLPSYA